MSKSILRVAHPGTAPPHLDDVAGNEVLAELALVQQTVGSPASTRLCSTALALAAEGVTIVRAAQANGLVDLAAMLKLLAARGITRLMAEGGPTLATALLAADLIDEAVLFHSPKVVGADGIDALEGMPLAALTKSPRLKCVVREPVGADTRTVFERR